MSFRLGSKFALLTTPTLSLFLFSPLSYFQNLCSNLCYPILHAHTVVLLLLLKSYRLYFQILQLCHATALVSLVTMAKQYHPELAQLD